MVAGRWSASWLAVDLGRHSDGVEQAVQRLRHAVDLGDQEYSLMNVEVVELVVLVEVHAVYRERCWLNLRAAVNARCRGDGIVIGIAAR
jgi:hypothetical protein